MKPLSTHHLLARGWTFERFPIKPSVSPSSIPFFEDATDPSAHLDLHSSLLFNTYTIYNIYIYTYIYPFLSVRPPTVPVSWLGIAFPLRTSSDDPAAAQAP